MFPFFGKSHRIRVSTMAELAKSSCDSKKSGSKKLAELMEPLKSDLEIVDVGRHLLVERKCTYCTEDMGPLLEAHSKLSQELIYKSNASENQSERDCILISKITSVFPWILQYHSKLCSLRDMEKWAKVFMVAVERQEYWIVDTMIKMGYSSNIMSADFVDPLQLALMKNDCKMAKLLMKHGSTLQMTSKGYGLHYAVKQRSHHLVEILLQEVGVAEIDYHNLDGRTALQQAVISGYPEIADLLLRYKANPNSRCRRSGYLVLHFAISKNNLLMTRLLLDRGAIASEFICEQKSREKTLLDKALAVGNEDIVALLLERGAEIVNPQNIVDDTKLLILTKQVTRLMYRNFKNVPPSFIANYESIKSDPHFCKYLEDIDKEMVQMKKWKIGGKLTLRDVFVNGENKLAIFVNNEKLTNMFPKSPYRTLSMCSEILEKNFRTGCFRRHLIISAQKLFHKFENLPPLPYVCLTKIFELLSNYDIMKFIVSSCKCVNEHTCLFESDFGR